MSNYLEIISLATNANLTPNKDYWHIYLTSKEWQRFPELKGCSYILIRISDGRITYG